MALSKMTMMSASQLFFRLLSIRDVEGHTENLHALGIDDSHEVPVYQEQMTWLEWQKFVWPWWLSWCKQHCSSGDRGKTGCICLHATHCGAYSHSPLSIWKAIARLSIHFSIPQFLMSFLARRHTFLQRFCCLLRHLLSLLALEIDKHIVMSAQSAPGK